MDLLANLSDFSWISRGDAWIGLVTLILLEVVLGIDNIVFISILTGKLPAADRPKARRTGLILAVIPRLIFLFLIGAILSMSKPLISIPWPFEQSAHHMGEHNFKAGMLALSGKDLILLVGGLFLIIQAVREIHQKLEGTTGDAGSTTEGKAPSVAATISKVMIQIVFMNIIFSLDSIITAIGMVKEIPVMMIAVIISTLIMLIAVNPVSEFVEKHPSVKILALAFLLLIGTNLVAESAHFHMPKGYVYFAMAFSMAVELINIRASGRRSQPVALHPPA
jgi:predicted tellurium resistance membrane protein TerC